jgi:hypothetical protein
LWCSLPPDPSPVAVWSSCIHGGRHDVATHDASALFGLMQMELSPSSFASPGSNSPRVDATWRLAWTFQQNALRCCRTDAETADGATAFSDLRVLADQPALFGKVAPVPTTCRAAGVGRRLWLSIPVESALERTWFSDLYQIWYKSELNPGGPTKPSMPRPWNGSPQRGQKREPWPGRPANWGTPVWRSAVSV